MDNVQIRVQILVPAYNVVNEIDDTIQSIWNQDFDKEKIYVTIVDFGSRDGTYEKILSYDSYHLGIYQVEGNFPRKQMVSEAAKFVLYPGGEYCYRMVLWPGDILYSNYLSRLTQVMYHYRGYNVSMVLSEVDLKTEDDDRISRPNLFQAEKVIDGKTEYMEYICRGYQHNIMCFNANIAIGRHRTIGENNEQIWWNKCRHANFERNAVYIPEHLSCIRQRFYEDELKEIILRWESLILFQRGYESKFQKKMTGYNHKESEGNLAYYALWRGFLLAERGKIKEAGNCLLMSGIVNPHIKTLQEYHCIEQYLMTGDKSLISGIREFFETDARA